jgi:hypothetical protein
VPADLDRGGNGWEVVSVIMFGMILRELTGSVSNDVIVDLVGFDSGGEAELHGGIVELVVAMMTTAMPFHSQQRPLICLLLVSFHFCNF